MKSVFVFGEVLWDVFPDVEVIGGAPFNFASHLSALGTKSYLLSAVGQDALGEKTIGCIAEKNVDLSYVKVIKKPTGVCNVTLDLSGTPSYDLVCDTAYDNISFSDEDIYAINNVSNKSLYMGSLSLRNSVSYGTLKKLIETCKWEEIFFDINIRQNYYSLEVTDYCLNACSVLKFSREEAWVFKYLGLSQYDETDLEPLCIDLADRFNIHTIILTLDKDGAVVYSSDTDTFVYSEKPSCKVVSTVGAGDSFFAAYISAYLNGRDTEKCLSDGVAVSGYVVGYMEAIPVYSTELIDKIKS